MFGFAACFVPGLRCHSDLNIMSSSSVSSETELWPPWPQHPVRVALKLTRERPCIGRAFLRMAGSQRCLQDCGIGLGIPGHPWAVGYCVLGFPVSEAHVLHHGAGWPLGHFYRLFQSPRHKLLRGRGETVPAVRNHFLVTR